MKADRRLSPVVASLAMASLVCLPFVSVPLTAAQEAAETPEAAQTPEAAPAKPQRLGRWERLREKITIEGSEYAGTETCAQSRCHMDTVQTWSKLRHTQYLMKAPLSLLAGSGEEGAPEEQGCESCHGPGSAHLIDRQHGRIARLSEHTDYVAALCNRCHHGTIEETHFRAGVHASANVSCGTCHDVHRDHRSVSLLRGSGVTLMWSGHGGRKGRRARQPAPAPAQPEAPAEPPATSPGSPGEPPAAEPPGAAPVQLTAQPAEAPPGWKPSSEQLRLLREDPTRPAGAEPQPPGAGPAPAESPQAESQPAPRKDPGAASGFLVTRHVMADIRSDIQKVNELCLACHQQQRGQFHQNSRHPLFEGRMTCTDCHNPHHEGEHAGAAALLTQDVDARCARCHTDKRGPFIFEHDMTVTGDGCQTCHHPHGSPNNDLIKLNGRALCLQCHTDIHVDPEHQRRPGSCWRAGCHVDFHGSQDNRLFLGNGARAQGATGARLTAARRPSPHGRGSSRSWVTEFRRALGILAQAPEEETDVEEAATPKPLKKNQGPARIVAGTGRAAIRPPLGDSPAQGVGGEDVILAAAPADASQPAPPAGAEAAPAPAPAEPAAPGGEEGTASRRRMALDLDVDGAYQNLNVSGNRSKAFQYTVPPSAFFADRLRLTLREHQGTRFGAAEWTGIDEPRQTAGVRLDGLGATGTGTALRYGYDRAAFFIEPSLNPRRASDREEHALIARWVPSGRGPEIRLLGESQRVDAPGLQRLSPLTGLVGLDYWVERFGPEVRFPLTDGSIRLQYSREEFDDRTRFLPDAGTNLWQVSLDRHLGAETSVFATFARAQIRQDGLPGNARDQRARLGVVTTLLPRLYASAQYISDEFRQPNTLNAFVRDRDTFTTRLRYRPQGWVSVEGGFERTGLRRLNSPQTFIHTPRWDGGWLAVRAFPRDNITFFARHRLRRLRDAPPAAIPALPSRLPLFYDDEDRTDAQLTVALPRDVQLYVNYGSDRRHNDPREVGFRYNTLNTGLSVPLSQGLSMNLDWSRQDWSGRGDPLTSDPLRLNFGRPLASDGDSISLGLAYLVNQDTLSLNLYRFTASGGESTRSQGILFGYEPRLSGWLAPRFEIGWDDYEDRVFPGLGYQSAVFRVNLARRF